MLGHYQVTARRLEKSLEKTRHEMVKLIRGVTNAEMLRRNTTLHEISRESLTPDDASPQNMALPPTGLVGMRIDGGSAVKRERETKKRPTRISLYESKAKNGQEPQRGESQKEMRASSTTVFTPIKMKEIKCKPPFETITSNPNRISDFNQSLFKVRNKLQKEL